MLLPHIIVSLVLLCSCDARLNSALDQAGSNREEMEKVLEHFKDNPDTLKYSAAVFLIENMPYHYTQDGKGVYSVDSAYLAMAEYPKEQREKVFKELTKDADTSEDSLAIDIRAVKADYIIKVIDEACDLWHEVNWNNEYSTQLFFDYVLPYRLLDEPLSDWKEAIRQTFPSLHQNNVFSKRGMQMEIEDLELTGCAASDKLGASKDKYVLLDHKGATVSFDIDVVSDCSKSMTFRYSATKRNTRLNVKINGNTVDALCLDPTNDANTFRLSRTGYVLKLRKGVDKVGVSFVGDTIGLDYVQICAIDECDEKQLDDYSKSYCMIKNMQNGYYITFDTLQASLLNILEAKPLLRNDSTQMVRMGYLGRGCWTISAFKTDTIDLCMEVQYARTDVGAPLTQYKYINGNNQKWIVMPIGNGLSRIMSKDTGLFLDTRVDEETGKTTLVQNPYTGAKSQQWRIEQKGTNPIANSKFTFGSALSEALRVYDVMGQFEWIGASTGFAPKASSLLKARTGNCRDEASFTVFLSRSLGIPAAIDFTPHWGNRSLSHQWSVLILPDGKSTPFYMGCVPGDTAHYFHSYLKPKIFRHRFQLNRTIANDMKEEKSVPKLFRAADWIDVTEEYYETTDVTRDVPEKYKGRKIAYICVFDNREWVPVHYGKVIDGKVTFTKMGRNVMYVSAFYENGRVVPFGNPFHILPDGTVKNVHADAKKKCTLNLTRKYPFFGAQDFFNFRMMQGRFQGSNTADFSKTTDLLYFNEVTNGGWYEFPVTDTGKYRYLRYKSPNGSYGNINELCFFDEKGDTIKGEIIGTEGVDWGPKERVFDNNILTGFQGISPDGHWVGLKLKTPKQVSKLRFIPRNDGNCIEVGDKYELVYWTNGNWKGLATVKAKENILKLKNMPSNGLYVLKNLTKGHEERIFTYEDGKQVWW